MSRAAFGESKRPVVSAICFSRKARAIKQGMMQQLLTGRIRLVAPVDRPAADAVDLVQST